MDLIENWIHIFEKHDEVAIFPFLKRLNATQKKDLLPQISKTAKAYLELKDRLINGKHFYTKKASLKQERILNYALLVTIPDLKHPSCKWLNKNIIATKIVADKILNWYCPTWFSDYINKLERLDFGALPMNYDLVMQMMKKKYVQPSELLIAKLLIRLIYSEVPNQKWVYQFQPQNLVLRTSTLKTHFWYLFQYPTQIYNCERLLLLADEQKGQNNNWYGAIKKHTKAGKIDRLQLLKSCLTTTTNPVFNKKAISWFVGLFDFINPTEEELLAVQKELFNTYTILHTKATNIALKAIQKIVGLPAFKIAESLIDFDKLFTGKTKIITINALRIIEKMAVSYPEKHTFLCEIVTNTFGSRTVSIQHKAAKFIEQYGKTNPQKLKALILPNKGNLLYSTRTILIDLFGAELNPEAVESLDNQTIKTNSDEVLREQNAIAAIDNFDQFLNLALPIFDNKAPYHFDQFLASILIFQKEIKGNNIGRLLPMFRRAYQLVFNELPSNHGMLDNMLATFLLDFSDLLISRYPKHSQGLKDLATAYLEQGFYINDQSIPFDLNHTHLNRWYNPFDPSQVYTPIKLLLEQVLTILHQAQVQPLLSTPTHSPSWITPLRLVEKLAFYQENQIVPHTIDLQLAISRMAFEGQATALKLANKKLKGRYLRLMNYLLSDIDNTSIPIAIESSTETAQPFGMNTTESYEFLVAAITKNSIKAPAEMERFPMMLLPSTLFTGNHHWMVFWEERQIEDWNHKTQNYEFVGESFIHRELQIKVPKGVEVASHPDFLYQYFPGSKEAFRPNLNDIERLLGLLPNNPSPLIMLLLADNLKYPTFLEIIAKKRVVEMISWLEEQNHLKYTPPIHLFLAVSMLCGDKKIRLKASETCKNAIKLNQLNANEFGKILGRLEYKEFAPLKRFTDLAQDHLLNTSVVHNQALEKIIANLLAKLPPIPIKQTKQLLLLYRELLAINQSTIQNERLLILLDLWLDSPSLKKVLKTLKEYVT